jgi:predicted nucleic acid-binding Zn ribbon protein
MEAIRETVKSLIEGLKKKQKVSRSGPEVALKKALTKKELPHIKFSYFRRGVLVVSVDSSSWLYNMNLQKEKLLAKMNKGNNSVKDIRFKLGEFR